MIEKSYGQICFEQMWSGQWVEQSAIFKRRHERVAQAVIDEYKKRCFTVVNTFVLSLPKPETREELVERMRQLAAKKAEEEREAMPEPITQAQYNERLLRALRAMG